MAILGNPAAVRQFMRFCAVVEPGGGWDEAERALLDGVDRAHVPHVSAALVVELMNSAALRLRAPDLGFQFARWLNPRGFGALGLMREHCRSLAQYYPIYNRYIHLESGVLSHEVAYEGDRVALVYRVLPVIRPRATPFLDSLVGLSIRVLGALLGAQWRPLLVELERPALQRRALEQMLGCSVRFGADRHAVVIARADYERELPGYNPEMVDFLIDELRKQATVRPIRFADQASALIGGLIRGGAPSVSDVAALMGCSSRSFQRRLAEQDVSFAGLLRDVRMAVVQRALTAGNRTNLQVLAHELGYSEASAAARFIKETFGAPLRRLEPEARGARPASGSVRGRMPD